MEKSKNKLISKNKNYQDKLNDLEKQRVILWTKTKNTN